MEGRRQGVGWGRGWGLVLGNRREIGGKMESQWPLDGARFPGLESGAHPVLLGLLIAWQRGRTAARREPEDTVRTSSETPTLFFFFTDEATELRAV